MTMKTMFVIPAEIGWDHEIRTVDLPSWPVGFTNPATTEPVIRCGQEGIYHCEKSPPPVNPHKHASEVGITAHTGAETPEMHRPRRGAAALGGCAPRIK